MMCCSFPVLSRRYADLASKEGGHWTCLTWPNTTTKNPAACSFQPLKGFETSLLGLDKRCCRPPQNSAEVCWRGLLVCVSSGRQHKYYRDSSLEDHVCPGLPGYCALLEWVDKKPSTKSSFRRTSLCCHYNFFLSFRFHSGNRTPKSW